MAAVIKDGRASFQKLYSADNYQLWTLKMKLRLHKLRLIDTINPAFSVELAENQTKSVAAFNELVSMIDERVLEQNSLTVRQEPIARELWQKLQLLFDHSKNKDHATKARAISINSDKFSVASPSPTLSSVGPAILSPQVSIGVHSSAIESASLPSVTSYSLQSSKPRPQVEDLANRDAKIGDSASCDEQGQGSSLEPALDQIRQPTLDTQPEEVVASRTPIIMSDRVKDASGKLNGVASNTIDKEQLKIPTTQKDAGFGVGSELLDNTRQHAASKDPKDLDLNASQQDAVTSSDVAASVEESDTDTGNLEEFTMDEGENALNRAMKNLSMKKPASFSDFDKFFASWSKDASVVKKSKINLGTFLVYQALHMIPEAYQDDVDKLIDQHSQPAVLGKGHTSDLDATHLSDLLEDLTKRFAPKIEKKPETNSDRQSGIVATKTLDDTVLKKQDLGDSDSETPDSGQEDPLEIAFAKEGDFFENTLKELAPEGETIGPDEWYINRGSDVHITGDRFSLIDYTRLPKYRIKMPDGSYLKARGKGGVRLSFKFESKTRHVTLPDVIYVPGIKYNHLSIAAITNQGIEHVERDDGFCYMRTPAEGDFMRGVKRGKSYILDLTKAKQQKSLPKIRVNSVQPLSVCVAEVPSTWQEALNGPEGYAWKEAFQKEVESLKYERIWNLESPPADAKIRKGRWVLIKKVLPDGNVARYKARWMIDEPLQEYGSNFFESFPMVVMPSTWRMIMALATVYNLEVIVSDVETVAPEERLSSEEQVWVEQPHGLHALESEGKVCRLNKTLAGYDKKSSAWLKELASYVRSIGFTPLAQDKAAFVNDDGYIIASLIDEIVIIGPSKADIEGIQFKLGLAFRLRPLGDVSNYLNVEVARNRQEGTTILTQRKYIQQLLHHLGMTTCKPTPSALQHGQPMRAAPPGYVAKPELFEKYERLVAALNWIGQMTRPDIAYSVNLLQRYKSNPTPEHITVAYHVLKYLASTPSIGIRYRSSPTKGGPGSRPRLLAYADAIWGDCADTRKSTAGYLIKLAEGPLDWASYQQDAISLCLAEAKARSILPASQALMHMGDIMIKAQYRSKSQALKLFIDNRSGIRIASGRGKHAQVAHIDPQEISVEDLLEERILEVEQIKRDTMAAKTLVTTRRPGLEPMTMSQLGLYEPPRRRAVPPSERSTAAT